MLLFVKINGSHQLQCQNNLERYNSISIRFDNHVCFIVDLMTWALIMGPCLFYSGPIVMGFDNGDMFVL